MEYLKGYPKSPKYPNMLGMVLATRVTMLSAGGELLLQACSSSVPWVFGNGYEGKLLRTLGPWCLLVHIGWGEGERERERERERE